MNQQSSQQQPTNQSEKNPAVKVAIITGIFGIITIIISAIVAPIIVPRLSSSPTPTPTAVHSQSVTQNPSSTPTTLPTPTGSTQTSSLKSPRLPLSLSSTSNDPVTVTITAITIDTNKRRMIWNLSFQNVSGTLQQYGLWPFYLQSSVSGDNTKYVATGDGMLNQTSCNIYLGHYLQPDEIVQKSVIFTFIPVTNTQYSLTSGLLCPTVTFNPVTFTF